MQIYPLSLVSVLLFVHNLKVAYCNNSTERKYAQMEDKSLWAIVVFRERKDNAFFFSRLQFSIVAVVVVVVFFFFLVSLKLPFTLHTSEAA